MRRRNWRLAGTGLFLLLFAAGFFIVMMSLAPQSTDPVELLRIAGMASGALAGVSLVLIILGVVGKKG